MPVSSRHLLLSLTLLLLLPLTASRAQTTALVGGTVVNPEGAPSVDAATVLIKDGRIAAVGPSDDVTVPEAADVIDASGKWIMPGLVDGHVHFFQSGGLYTRPDIIDLRAVRPYEKELALIKERLPDTFRRYLRSGITSVVDVGGPEWNLTVRAKADTTAMAPRVTVAGPLISSVQPAALTTDDPPILKVETPEEARRIVRDQVEAGFDLIKIWYIVRPNETPAAFRPVAEATIDEAHKRGKRVAVHATELETARTAVELGADILVHSVFDERVDDAFVQLLAENDVLYTPTIMVMERYREVFTQQLDLTLAEHRYAHPEVINTLFDLRELPDDQLPRGVRQQMQRSEPVEPSAVALDNLKTLHDAGVPIVAGTDAGNIGTPHGPALFYELQLMQQAGLSPEEVLTAATVGGARLADRTSDLGTVEEGKLADLVVLGSDPRADIANTSDIERVVKGGRVFAPTELLDPAPADLVQRHVNAYCAEDLDAYLDTFGPRPKMYLHPDSLIAEGREQIRARYRQRFEEAPWLHTEVLDRITMGSAVIDHVRVTGMPGRDAVEAVEIYEVGESGIDRVWFVLE